MKPDIGRESRFLPIPSFKAPVRGPAVGIIVTTFGVEKLEWCGYPMVTKF